MNYGLEIIKLVINNTIITIRLTENNNNKKFLVYNTFMRVLVLIILLSFYYYCVQFTCSYPVSNTDIEVMGTSVFNQGPTQVLGSVGAQYIVTGFPYGFTKPNSNSFHINDVPFIQGQSEASVLYNSALATTCTVNYLSPQDLGGLTLTSGVYCFSSSAQITGTLILGILLVLY